MKESRQHLLLCCIDYRDKSPQSNCILLTYAVSFQCHSLCTTLTPMPMSSTAVSWQRRADLNVLAIQLFLHLYICLSSVAQSGQMRIHLKGSDDKSSNFVYLRRSLGCGAAEAAISLSRLVIHRESEGKKAHNWFEGGTVVTHLYAKDTRPLSHHPRCHVVQREQKLSLLWPDRIHNTRTPACRVCVPACRVLEFDVLIFKGRCDAAFHLQQNCLSNVHNENRSHQLRVSPCENRHLVRSPVSLNFFSVVSPVSLCFPFSHFTASKWQS